MGGDYDRAEQALIIHLSQRWNHRYWFIQVKSHLDFALFLMAAVWLAPFREDATKRYLPPAFLSSPPRS